MIETGNLNVAGGLKLFFRARPPENGRIPVVVTHGFAEHSGRYGEVLDALHANGYGAVAFDFRGHGHSEGKRGFISSISDYVSDLSAAVDFALERYQTDKALILAHSMGGLIATQYATKAPEKVLGLVLSSPLFGIKIEVPRWKKGLGAFMAKYWPSFSMPNQIDANLLTHDAAKAEVYRSDPLIFHHVCAKWFEEILEATSHSVETAKKLQIPFLLQLSEDDHIVSYAKSCEWFKSSSNIDKRLITYPGFFHEIYNERERQKPINDFVGWMLERWPSQEVKSHGTSGHSSVRREEDQAQAG